LAFEADEPPEAIMARLRSAGFDPGPIVDENFGRSVRVRDPDGVWVQINEVARDLQARDQLGLLVAGSTLGLFTALPLATRFVRRLGSRGTLTVGLFTYLGGLVVATTAVALGCSRWASSPAGSSRRSGSARPFSIWTRPCACGS
jgi:hypothetical protein